MALIPCTSSITDVTGKSTISLYNNPTVSSSPAGAPGGLRAGSDNSVGMERPPGLR
jgi:hypothetical protein